MTRTYQRRNGDTVTFAVYPGDNERMTFTVNDRSITVPIVKDHEYTFRLRKTLIRACDGAAGLFKFLDDCYMDDFGTCWADKVVYHAMTMKGEKQ